MLRVGPKEERSKRKPTNCQLLEGPAQREHDGSLFCFLLLPKTRGPFFFFFLSLAFYSFTFLLLHLRFPPSEFLILLFLGLHYYTKTFLDRRSFLFLSFLFLFFGGSFFVLAILLS